MKVEGYAALRLRRPANEGGAYKTVFALHVALPEVFKSGPSAGAGGVTGDVSINIDTEGVHLDGLKIQVTNAYIGKLGVKRVCLSFAAAGSSAVAPCTGAVDRPAASRSRTSSAAPTTRRTAGTARSRSCCRPSPRPSSASGAACAAAG